MEVRKQEVEKLLGCGITEGRFSEALSYAVKKQAYIYGCEKREAVLQHPYLVMLTAEYVRDLAFSQITMELCREACNMEKEHPAQGGVLQ